MKESAILLGADQSDDMYELFNSLIEKVNNLKAQTKKG